VDELKLIEFVLQVTKRKEVKNLNPSMLLISLFGALAWTSYGCISVTVNYYVVVRSIYLLVPSFVPCRCT
jgi:uncharacterized protein with PQ loop repeat